MRVAVFAVVFSLSPAVALGQSPFTALHPEEAIPDTQERVQSGLHSELFTQVQERLRALGFNPGPVNGDWNEKTQAALAQFQLSLALPASGGLDDMTLAHLGVRDYPAAAGASATPAGDALLPATTREQSDTGTGGSASAGSSAERTAEPKSD